MAWLLQNGKVILEAVPGKFSRITQKDLRRELVDYFRQDAPPLADNTAHSYRRG